MSLTIPDSHGLDTVCKPAKILQSQHNLHLSFHCITQAIQVEMPAIIRRSPFSDQRTEAQAPTGPVLVRSFQVIVWVSLVIRDEFSPRFPTILDTGHSHNFSINAQHLQDWAQREPQELKQLGIALVNQQPVTLRQCPLALWRNVPGQRDLLKLANPEILQLPDGIAVHESANPYAPRLPLLGMRALVRNRLRVVIDGSRMRMNISRPWR